MSLSVNSKFAGVLRKIPWVPSVDYVNGELHINHKDGNLTTLITPDILQQLYRVCLLDVSHDQLPHVYPEKIWP
jgi:hypothetical protein